MVITQKQHKSLNKDFLFGTLVLVGFLIFILMGNGSSALRQAGLADAVYSTKTK